MEYVSGAERESGGIITLEGTGFGNEVAYILEFRAIGAGDAGLAVQDARVYSAGDEAVSYTVSALPTVPVDIQGEDSGDISFFDRLQRERQEEPGDGQGFETDIPILGNITGRDGKLLHIVDAADYEPPVALWDYKLVTGTYGDEDFTYISDQGRTVRVVLMIDEDGRFHPYAYAEADGSFYPVDEIVSEGRPVISSRPGPASMSRKGFRRRSWTRARSSTRYIRTAQGVLQVYQRRHPGGVEAGAGGPAGDRAGRRGGCHLLSALRRSGCVGSRRADCGSIDIPEEIRRKHPAGRSEKGEVLF